jgi:WD40 repeat protein
LGIGGVGKSSLAAQLVRTVADQFDLVIWSSLLNAPPPSDTLRHWLGLLIQSTGSALPAGEEEQLRLLLTCLRQQRCLLILDNAESILLNQAEFESELVDTVGTMRQGYEGYERLLQSLSQEEHQSSLLITSRELPRVLRNAATQNIAVRVLPLAGLALPAGQALLKAQGLTTDPHTTRLLIDQYSGNPLALQIVSHTIVDLYGGDVHSFTAEGTPIFDDIRAVLDQQIARLTKLEHELLLWLAIERQPITSTTLRSNLLDKGSQRSFLEALRGLQRRSLLEKVDDGGFTLQNVIIEYLTDYFVEAVCAEFAHWSSAPSDPEAHVRTIFASLFNRHTLLKAEANEAVRQSQIRLILHPIAERVVVTMGKKAFANQAHRWLDWLRASELPLRGYAAGNLLNLLLHLGIEVTGFNFSRLAVWQAFLRGAYLPRLDLTEADLTGSVFTHRFGEINALLFNEQNELTVAGMRDGALQTWRAVTGELLLKCSLDGLRADRVGWSNDGRFAVVTNGDGVAQLFDVPAGRRLTTLVGVPNVIWQIRISADNQQIACGDRNGQISIWTFDGQLLHRLQGHTTPVTGLAYAAGDQPELLATSAVDGSICLWNARTGQRLHRLQGHTGEVAALGFAANGTILASGSNDFSARLWDVESGRLLHTLLRHTQPIRNLAVTPLGNLLATGSGDKLVYVWDIQTGEVRHILGNQSVIVARLSFSPDEQTLATFDLNGRISLWNMQQGQRLDTFQIYRNAFNSAALSLQQQRVIAAGGDGAIYVWALDEAAPETAPRLLDRVVGHGHSVAAVAFSPDGETFASGDIGRTILLHNLRTKTRQTLQGHQSNIVSLDFSADGQFLASASGDGNVGVWAVNSGQRRHMLQGHTNAVTFSSFSPDSLQIASSSIDMSVCLWDAESGVLQHRLQGHTNAVQCVVFSADGQQVISSSFDQTLRVWASETGQLLTTWTSPNTVFVSLAVHPEGKLLAAGGQDQLLYLLELPSGRILRTMAGHNYAVDSVKFSRDGRLLLTASHDETVKLWRFDPQTGDGYCFKTYRAPGPYADMKIAGVTGIRDRQKAALIALGAVEEMGR